jgi:tetratricopeptide (TPR) repeat protein
MADRQASDPDALLAQGHAAYHALRLDEAAALYRTALAARPDDYDACLGLARTLTRQRDQEEARAYAERCMALDPGRYEGYAALGTLAFLADRLDEARDALNDAVERAPHEPEPHLTLTQVYADLRRFDEARAELERGRETIRAIAEDGYRRQMEAFAFHVETYLHLAERKDAEARESAQEVIAREADNPHAACLAYSNLGILEARARRYDTAIEYLERAFAMNPYFYRMGAALGRILLVRNHNERAAEVLQQVLETAPPESGSTRYTYALALARLKRRDEARKQFHLALEEGLRGVDHLMARWQLVWQSRVGRQALIGLVLVAMLVWVVVGNPPPTTLTFLALLVVIVVLQRTVGRRRR